MRFASGVFSGGSTSASCNMARTAIAAPTGPDEVVARPGIWAQTELQDPKIRPPRSKHNGIWPGTMMCDARSSRLGRKRGNRVIDMDYIEGKASGLVRMTYNGSAGSEWGTLPPKNRKWNHMFVVSCGFDCNDSAGFL